MKLLFRWFSLRYRLRSRRWRKRALAAEARLCDTQTQLEAEMWRNRNREDMFVSATVMGTRGMYGVASRNAPAPKQLNALPVSTAPPTDPDGFTYADRMEFDLYWRTDAEAAGVPIQEAKQKFLSEIASRRLPLNDDPFSN